MSRLEQPSFGLGLTIDQAALIMEALAECPFRAVFALIGRLNAWANQTFAADGTPIARGTQFTLSADELALIVEALGALPHRRVHKLIASLQGHAHHG